MADGILVINKPRGMTSHDVVAKLRRAYNMKKIGHTGTLDPMVDGVMVVCFGKGTKLAQYLTDESKKYQVEFCLGVATTTEDLTGERIEEQTFTVAEVEQLRTALPEAVASLVGQHAQIPPMYSAVKIAGKKLYEYARDDIEVARVARNITIYDIAFDKQSIKFEEGKIFGSFEASVSKGTYIRTLCVELGKKLGVPATMSCLTRSASGKYTIEQALPLDIVLETIPELIKIDDIELSLPTIYVEGPVAEKLKTGYKLPHYFVEKQQTALFCVKNIEDEALIGIYTQSIKYPDKYESVRVI